jgi:hypothetical protein
MSRPQIGKAKYGSTQKKFWKLKDGDSVYGILPPLGDLAQDGRWSVYYKIHYGYKDASGKSRPFQSCLVENRKSKMVEVPDAACDRLALLKGQLQVAKDSGNEKAKEALFKLVGGQKSIYNLDNNHHVNAIDLQGNIGILKLRHKAKLALDVEIAKLRKRGIDPLGVENRRFFLFSRSGNAMDTTFKVDVYKKTINVPGVGDVEQEVVFTLTDDILDRLGDEAAQLDRIFKAPSAEEVAQIVSESTLVTGVSPNINEILGFTKNGAKTDAEEVDDSPNEEEPEQGSSSSVGAPLGQPLVAATTTPTAVLTAPAPISAPAPQQTPQAPVVAAPAPTPAPVAAAPAPAPKTTAAPPPTTADSLSKMSDKEFLASLGVPQ